MPHKGWNWAYVGCPFYLRDDAQKKTIDCSGFCDGCKKGTYTFRTRNDFEIQMEVFCKKYWEKCEVYRMISGMYEE